MNFYQATIQGGKLWKTKFVSKLHKVKKHWITIAASSLAIGASLIGLGQVGADEVKPETTAVNSPENVVSDSNLETSASLITRTRSSSSKHYCY
ncbi:MAG: KxYKxGKxW signal peptide domain-containing protein [Streptococcus sp.]|uniref:KxYKxGKxW signal peptide domain-containing protein n=1 Tax=Streptococcus sp. TaxID=1306 RepID=UPI003994814B